MIVPHRLLHWIALIAAACGLDGCIVPELRSFVVRVAPDVQSISLRRPPCTAIA
jgi:hypothetical protein